MNVNRFIVIVLDSVGIGEAPDAADFGDVGSHTLGNIARVTGGLNLPNIEKMGLGNIAILQGVDPQTEPTAVYGKLTEISAGKDTTTGHWELMGIELKRPFPLYPNGFPPEVMGRFEGMIGMRRWATIPLPAPSSSKNWAQNICAPASPSSTPPATAFSRLRRMKKSFPSMNCTRCAILPARFCVASMKSAA